jgi:hypothetical protein
MRPRRPAPEGADWPHWRARGVGAVRKEEEKERVGFAHHTESLRKRPRARKEQRRVISDGGGSGGAPADGVGAPGGVEDVNL